MMRIVTCFCVVLYLAVPSADAITLRQIDTFSGSTSFSRGEVVPTGGPQGNGDGYYRVGRDNLPLSVVSTQDWGGNYVLAGITRIDFDVVNFGPSPLSIRLVLRGSRYWLIAKTVVPQTPDGIWLHRSVSIAPEDLIVSPESVGSSIDALGAVDSIGLYHWPDLQQSPPSVSGDLGIDNIRAVPEPGMFGLVAVAMLCGCGRRRRGGA